MAKLVTDALLKKSIEDVLTELVNSTYSWESYSDEEIGNLVELDPTQVAELSAVISDTQVAKNKVFSSFHTKELLQENIIEANKYADDLVANLSNIELDIVDALPDSTTVNKSTIYILKDSTGGTNNTLNVWSSSTNAFVEVGKFSIDLSTIYTKTEVDNLLADKANADEVLKPDAIVSDLTTTSGSTILSTAGLQTELDKMKQNFQDGVDTVYDAVVAKGATPVDKTPSEIAKAIGEIETGTTAAIPLVPKLTSDTSHINSDGEVIFSTNYVENLYCYGYKAFNGYDDGYSIEHNWYSSGRTDQWLGFKFNSPKEVVTVELAGTNNASGVTVNDFKVQGSNDGASWDELLSTNYGVTALRDMYTCGEIKKFNLTRTGEYTHYRVLILNTTSNNTFCALAHLQFYGKEKVAASSAPVLLWENPNPKSEFARTQIDLDLTGYNKVIITCGFGKDVVLGYNSAHSTSLIDVGTYGALGSYYEGLNNSPATTARIVNVSNTYVAISTGIRGANTIDNFSCVPLKIYGVKRDFAL